MEMLGENTFFLFIQMNFYRSSRGVACDDLPRKPHSSSFRELYTRLRYERD